jgi:hypothetical protein
MKEGDQAQHDLKPWTVETGEEAQEAPLLWRIIQAGWDGAYAGGALRWSHRGEPH